jgi:chromosome partitioning protein
MSLAFPSDKESTGLKHLLIDLDPQASATEWGDSRDAEMPAVVSAQASRLAQVLQTAAAQGVEIVFIDTAPLSETTALAAACAADLILVPCRPSLTCAPSRPRETW